MKSEKLRNLKTTLRLNSEEKTKIKDLAYRANLPLAVFIRESALGQEIKAALSISEMTQIRSLSYLGNNLNQVTKKMHQKGLVSSANEIDLILKKIQEILM